MLDRQAGPELTQQWHLLIEPPSTLSEICSERLKFDPIPPCADAQAEAISRKKSEIKRLLGDKHSLPLRENQHARSHLESCGETAYESEQHQWIMEWIMLVIGSCEDGIAISVLGTYHMIVGQHMVEAAFLQSHGKLSCSSRTAR